MIAYICSPFNGGWTGNEWDNPDRERNVAYAAALGRVALLAPELKGLITDIEVPHVFYPAICGPHIPRDKAIRLGLNRMDVCDVVIVGRKYGISTGMGGEIIKGTEMGLPIIQVNEPEEVVQAVLELRECPVCGTWYMPDCEVCSETCAEWLTSCPKET